MRSAESIAFGGPDAIESPLEEAKALALRRVEADRAAASDDLEPMLGLIARQLFETDFRPCRGFQICVDDVAVRLRFRLAFGVLPEEYRDQRVLDAARYLVYRSDLPVAEIAAGLGFTDPELFTKWFRRRTGVAPQKARDAAREADAPAPPTDAPEPAIANDDEAWISQQNWRRLMIFDAPRALAEALVLDLIRAYPEALEDTALEDTALDDTTDE